MGAAGTVWVRQSASGARRERTCLYTSNGPCRVRPLALRIEVGERSTFLHVRQSQRQYRRIAHAKAPINAATASPICQHGEEGVVVDGVLTLAEALRAVLRGLSVASKQ